MSIRIKFFLFFALLSYIPALAQVDTAWVRRYNSPFNGSDIATALAVDDSGNVYVTGYVEKVGGGSVTGITTDYATVKYAPNGDLLWARLYNGSGNLWDEAYAIAVDD